MSSKDTHASSDHSKLYMNDVRLSDAGSLKRMAAHPDFFYVFINDNGKNPLVGGAEYAALCETAIQARIADQPRAEGVKGWAQHQVAGLFKKAADTTPYDKVYAKALRNEQGELVGATVLMKEKAGKTEIGYFLHPDYQGQGLGIKMARSALNWAMKHTDISVVYGDVDPSNEASCRVLNSLGLGTKVSEVPVGKYKETDGTPIPSRIVEGSREQIEGKLRDYVSNDGGFFEVRDSILDRSRVSVGLEQRRDH